MWITVLNWKRFNDRSDVKHSSWFRFENTLVDDPAFDEFDGDEFKAFIYILSWCSRKNSGRVFLTFSHAFRTARIPEDKLKTALRKLKEIEVIDYDGPNTDRERTEHVTPTVREEHVNDPQTTATDGRTDGRISNTCHLRDDILTEADLEQEFQNIHETFEEPTTHPLVDLWNENCGSLPKVRELNLERRKKCAARWKECKTKAEWKAVIKYISESDFHTGKNDRAWKANFDYLLKPKTRIEISERIGHAPDDPSGEGHWI